MRSWQDEAASPKYSHIERERRWLVDPAARPPLDHLRYVEIEDFYVRGTRFRVRRMTDPATGTSSCKLSKKYPGSDPLARPMVTFYLTEEEHGVLKTLDADPLRKRRYAIVYDGREWSLDIFGAPFEGTEILEIEAASAAELESLVPPAWATREISRDSGLSGGALAERAAGASR